MTADGASAISKGERTRRKLKAVALRLFAERGLDNVSIRDIQHAAGQKNNGSIAYYFASRDALIRELVADVGQVLDASNNERLDLIESAGGPNTVREVTDILLPDLPDRDPRQDGPDAYMMRFFASVMIARRELLFDAMHGQDRGTRRCFSHLRRLAPEMPPEVLQQRLMLMLIFSLTTGAAMEAALENREVWKNLWGRPSARSNLADTMAGMLLAPVSEETHGIVARGARPAG